MGLADASSNLIEYLQNAPDHALIAAFVRRIRAWRQIKGEAPSDIARRQRIEAGIAALITADPARRVPLAVEADLEEPGPVPRLITDRVEDWLTPGLVRHLLNAIPSMDDRYRPLLRHCAQRAIDEGAEDGQTVILYITGLRDAGEVDEAERLAKKALAVSETAAEDMEETGTLLSLLAEMAFDDERFEEAVELWQRRLKGSDDPASILNNCGAALQHLGRLTEAGRAFRDAARAARRHGKDDPAALRALGSAHVNAAMQALERGRDGAAVDLARRGTEYYRDLLARHPGHSDNDIADLFAPFVSALEETGRIDEANALTQEMLSLARARYRQSPDVAATGLAEILRAFHQDALAAGRYDEAGVLSKELRVLAERHADRPFGIIGVHAGLALAAQADEVFLSGESEAALVLYENVEQMLPDPPSISLAMEIFGTRLSHAMALADAGRRELAAERICTLLPSIEALAERNNWLWTLAARGYANLAVVEGERGRVEEARAAIDRAGRAFARMRAGSRSQRIDAIEQANAIANSFSHIGEHDVAAQMLRDAAADARRMEQEKADPAAPMLLFAALNDLGLTEYAAGRDVQAAEAFADATHVAQAAPEGTMMAERVSVALVNRAAALLEAHRFDAALAALDQAAPLTGPGRIGWTDYLNNRAALHSGRGDYEQALALFIDAHDAADDMEDSARAALNIAKTYGDLDRWAEAREEALSLVEALYDDVVDPDGVDPVTLYFWLAARIIAARGAAVTIAPAEAIREATEARDALDTLGPALDRDISQLRGYALEALGDALAAGGQQGQAKAAWGKARALFEHENLIHMNREICRLAAKENSP